jgi:hypothetical protein
MSYDQQTLRNVLEKSNVGNIKSVAISSYKKKDSNFEFNSAIVEMQNGEDAEKLVAKGLIPTPEKIFMNVTYFMTRNKSSFVYYFCYFYSFFLI